MEHVLTQTNINHSPLPAFQILCNCFFSFNFFYSQAESLRKKSSRVEDENESLIMQVKKMATKARSKLDEFLMMTFLSLIKPNLLILVLSAYQLLTINVLFKTKLI